MSVEKEYGKFIVICDLCDESMPAADNWNDALSEAKAEGWQSKCVAGTWENYCPLCKED